MLFRWFAILGEMISKKVRWGTVAFVGLCWACTKGESGEEKGAQADAERQVEVAAAAHAEALSPTALRGLPGDKPTQANACLLGFQTKYDEALSLAEASAASGLAAADAKVKYQKVLKDPAHHEATYAWPSERTRKMTVMGREMSVPQSNLVAIGSIVPMTKEYFLKSYRPIREEEKQELGRQIEASADERLATDQQKKTAKGLGGVLSEVTKAYREVGGIGEAASFNTFERSLYVLDRGVRFRVTADLSDDADADEKKAIELARRFMAKCP